MCTCQNICLCFCWTLQIQKAVQYRRGSRRNVSETKATPGQDLLYSITAGIAPFASVSSIIRVLFLVLAGHSNHPHQKLVLFFETEISLKVSQTSIEEDIGEKKKGAIFCTKILSYDIGSTKEVIIHTLKAAYISG